MSPWNAFVTRIVNCTAHAHGSSLSRMPTMRSSQDRTQDNMPETDVLPMLDTLYHDALQKYKMDTPYAATAQHRTTSTYVQDIWHGRVANTHHTRHPFYDTPGITHQQYRAWIRIRTLTLPLPIYNPILHTHPTCDACPLACASRGDLRHWALQCEAVQLELAARSAVPYSPPPSLHALFNNFPDIPTLAAQICTLYCLSVNVV